MTNPEQVKSGPRGNMTSKVTVSAYAHEITNQQLVGRRNEEDSEEFHSHVHRRMADNPCFKKYIKHTSNPKHFTVECRKRAFLGCFKNIAQKLHTNCRPVYVSYGKLKLIQDCKCAD